MKMKRLLALLLALVMCFSLASCKKTAKKKSSGSSKKDKSSQSDDATAGSGGQTEDNVIPGPILYRATDKNDNVAWLFGSIHYGRESFYPLPTSVLNAFAGADELAVEADIVAFEKDTSAQVQASQKLIYRDGTTIKDHLPEELYNRAVSILKEQGAYNTVYDLYCPSVWSGVIEGFAAKDIVNTTSQMLGIDRYFIDQAMETGKPIAEIESAEAQYQMQFDFDDAVQAYLLETAIASYENPAQATAAITQLMDLWESGDEKAFDTHLNTLDPTLTDEEKAIYGRYHKAMIADRNITMTDYAESALASGKKVFICVGAAHVVGKNAMADLLTQRGYTVERIYETKTTDTPATGEDAENIAELTAYVSFCLTDAQARALGTKISQMEGVISAQYISAEQVLQEFLASQENPEAFDGIDPSIMQAKYCITVKADAADNVKQQLAVLSGIVKIQQATKIATQSGGDFFFCGDTPIC